LLPRIQEEERRKRDLAEEKERPREQERKGKKSSPIWRNADVLSAALPTELIGFINAGDLLRNSESDSLASRNNIDFCLSKVGLMRIGPSERSRYSL
jgi:hypothetical protein